MLWAEDERDDDDIEDQYRDRLRLMPRLQAQRERTIRCAYLVDGLPCGAQPNSADRSGDLPALERHVRMRHLGAGPEAFARLVLDGVSLPVQGQPFAYLYYLGDPDRTAWCFAGSEREYAAWAAEMSSEPVRRPAAVAAVKEAATAELAYAF